MNAQAMDAIPIPAGLTWATVLLTPLELLLLGAMRDSCQVGEPT